MLHEDDNTAVIGLYGVVFGGEDLVGETFQKSTDFKLNRVNGVPVHIDHTSETYVKFNGQEFLLKGISDEVGEILEVSPDEIGLYMKLKFEKSNEYWDMVNAMYQTGRMGASTGSDHRARKSVDGLIEIWPINEVSLTLTPAEPRTTENVTRLKSNEPDEITFKRNGETIKISIEESIESTNKLTDSHEKSAEGEQEGSTEPASQSDTEELDIIEEAELSAIEQGDAMQTPEVSEMTQENVATPEVAEETVKGFDFKSAFDGIGADIKGVSDKLGTLEDRIEAIENEPQSDITVNAKSATVLSMPRGDTESNAIKAWALGKGGDRFEVKASNATDMNIGTAADGGNLAATGFYNQIIMRRDETDLTTKLPLLRIPGTENSVEIPTFDEDDGELVTTAEAVAYDEDAPAVGKKTSTLVWKTKVTKISNQLLQSASIDGGVEALLAQFIGMGVAKTRNEMLVTEVLANGTAGHTFAGAAAIAFGEPESILKNNNLSPYLDSDNAAAWLMSNNTLWTIRSIVGNDRQYYSNQDDEKLLGYDVVRTQKMPAVATGNKSVVFGNWNYMAYRESPDLTLIRDQYTLAATGQIRVIAHFAAAFNVTQAEALVYGTQA